MSSEVNYRQQWAEGEIEAGTLLDAIDALQYANLRLSQDCGGAKYERDAALAQLSALEAENARLTAQLAAIQGGMGEAVEVVATLQERENGRKRALIPGHFHDQDAAWAFKVEPLMTVAQHQRITAAMAAEVERLKLQLYDFEHGDLDYALKERDALASELEAIKGQEPVAIANKGDGAFWVSWTDAGKPLRGPGIKLYTLPAAPEGGEV